MLVDKNKKRILLILTVFSLSAIVLFSTFMIYRYFYILPKEKINSMQSRMLGVDKLSYKGSINFFGEMDGAKIDMKLFFEGYSNDSQKGEVLSIKTVGFYNTLPLSVVVDFLILERDAFLKFSEIPEVIKSYGGIEGFENRWARIDSFYDNDFKIDFIFDRDFLSEEKYLGKEDIDGNPVGKYLVKVSARKIQEAVVFDKANLFLTESEVNSFAKSIDNMGDLTFYLWIEEETSYLRKAEGKIPLSFSETDYVNIEISIMFNDFNLESIIEPPEVYEEVAEVFESFLE